MTKGILALVALSWLSFQCQHCLAAFVAADTPKLLADVVDDCHPSANQADTAAAGDSEECDCAVAAVTAGPTPGFDRALAQTASEPVWLIEASASMRRAAPIATQRLRHNCPENAALLPLERFCVLLN